MEVKIGEVNNGVIPVKLLEMVDYVISVAKENKMAAGQWKEWFVQTSLYIHDKNGNENRINIDNNMTPNNTEIDHKWQKYDMNMSQMEYTKPTEDRRSPIFGFYIRVPFYFIEYGIDLKFRLLNAKLKNESELKVFKSQSSQIYNIKIPSFLIEPKFEVGQSIVYVVPNAHFCWDGKIIKIIKNNNNENDNNNNDNDNNNVGCKDTVIGSGGLDDTTIDDETGDNVDDDNKNNENNNGCNDKVASDPESEIKKNDDDDDDVETNDKINEKRKESDCLESNVRYLIEIDKNYNHIDYSDKNNYIFTADHTQLYRDAVSFNFTINIINRKEIECDFVLRNNNNKIRQYYWDLRNMISQYYQIIYKDYIELEKKKYWNLIYRYDFDLIGGLLSSILCEYLFDLNSNSDDIIDYKIRCFMNSSFDCDDGMIFNDNHWKYMIKTHIDAIERGAQVDGDVQSFDTSGWNCDMCRCGLHVNDWCFHCHKDGAQSAHDYCINCTYSMANEIIKFEHYLQDIIHTSIDSQFTMDCIQILVAFVCGYAKKSC